MASLKEKKIRHYKELYGILFLALGVFFGLCLLSYNPADPAFNSASNISEISNLGGVVGAYLADILFTILGLSAYVFCASLILLSAMQFMGRTIRVTWPEVIAYTLLVIAASTMLHLKWEVVEIRGQTIGGGGLIGSLLGVILQHYLNTAGAYTMALALFVVSFLYATHISVRTIWSGVKIVGAFLCINLAKGLVYTIKGIAAVVKGGFPYVWSGLKRSMAFAVGLVKKLFDRNERDDEVRINNVPRPIPSRPKMTEEILAEQKPITKPPEPKVDEEKPVLPAIDPKIHARTDAGKKITASQMELVQVSKDYAFPALSLLDVSEQAKADIDEASLKKNAILLQKKIHDYGVEGKITEIHPGPVITMYEFEPAPGVKINKIVGLADDLAVAMGGRSIRVVPHLPGKAAIGIEIPNNIKEIVYLKEIVSDQKFVKNHSKLTIALGKNTQGTPVISDLTKMPHLLVAGATGSGKSVAINAMILSILYKATPEDVRIIMIDPKTLELSDYNGIPHLLLPVVTEPRKANFALQWALREMERRYKMLSEVHAKNIGNYNIKIEKGQVKLSTLEEAQKAKDADPNAVVHLGKLPYIVIIIDELADLMMVSSKDIEENITRLAQMARAAGIHLIVATQRPSVDVITGLIKANIPTRIAFKVSAKHDSRTIIDANGAEHLLGNGDMLFMPPNTSGLVRIHGAYVTEEEINRVVKHLKEQGEPQYDESIIMPVKSTEEGETDAEYDELYDTAVKLVAETRQASISMVQRRLRIGYNRAARMIERMEASGVVGPQDGSKPREVFVSNIGSEN